MNFNKFIFSAMLAIIVFSGVASADVVYDSIVSDANAKGVPCIATLGQDSFMVAWTDGSDNNAKYSIFTPSTGTWSAPAAITGVAAQPQDLALISDGNGKVLAAWLFVLGGSVEANFYDSGWGTKTTWSDPNADSLDVAYDSNHTAWTVIIAHGGVISDFNVATYTDAKGWLTQTVGLTDTKMGYPSVKWDNDADQLVTTYEDVTSNTGFAFLTTSFTVGEYGDGDGGDWGTPVEVAGTASMVAPGHFYVNGQGVGALAYEDSTKAVYITKYSGGAFAGISKQVSADNPNDFTVNLAYYSKGSDDDGTVWWIDSGNTVKQHDIDTSGDPSGSDKTAVSVAIDSSSNGKSTANNTSGGAKTGAVVVVTDDGGGNTGIVVVPSNPSTVVPTNSSVTSAPSSTTATINWNSDVLTGNAKVNYDTITPPSSSQSETDATPHKSPHTVDLSGLSSGTTYFYSIEQQVSGKQTTDTDDNGELYYDFDTTASGGSSASPGLEVYGLIIVVAVGLGLFVAMRKQH